METAKKRVACKESHPRESHRSGRSEEGDLQT